MTAPQLNDAQKGDLARLWERHAPVQTLTIGGGGGSSSYDDVGGGGGGGRGYGRGRGRGGRGRGGRGGGGGGNSRGVAPTSVVKMSLEDEDYIFVCRLYSFLRRVMERMEQQAEESMEQVTPSSDDPEKENQHPESDDANGNNNESIDDDVVYDESRTWDSLTAVFQKIKATKSSGGSNDTKQMIVPRVVGGKQIITFNHESFLEEFGSYEGNNNSSSTNNNSQSSQQMGGNRGSSSSSLGSYLLFLF